MAEEVVLMKGNEAIALNPDSPAAEARNMVMDILNFYNKDMFNQ